MMGRGIKALALAAGMTVAGALGAAQAAEPLKIGMMVTLSGPPAVLGNHIRDGFQLFVDENGG
jgi:branched-chain amino acid transport system substrate-binding protein